jgi:alginate O-acetyltransferase complex protein AlgI
LLFNSLGFLYFFLIVFLLQYLLRSFVTGRKVFLLLASYIFYMFWNVPFVLLVIGSSLLDFHIGKRLYSATSVGSRRALLLCSLVFNLGVLAFFKYGNFFIAQTEGVVSLLGISMQAEPMDIVLPLGISFYTFQTLSYSIDMYRRSRPPSDSLLDFMLYVTFFPQLVAGPIVRSGEFLPQLKRSYRLKWARMSYGATLIMLGLVKKVLIADRVGVFVDQIYGDPTSAGFLAAWCATVGFAIQIYCDFSGYSDMAVGMAKMLGYDLPRNFRMPYLACGFSNFWGRWHITLSAWLRDYLYIPLGGNRCPPVRVSVNLMVTMLLGGLWHGANWTFVIWGGLHGIYLIAERILIRISDRHQGLKAFARGSAGHIFLTLTTFFLTNLAWVFFRASSLEEALHLLRVMLFFDGMGPFDEIPFRPMLMIGIVLGFHLVQWRREIDLRFQNISTFAWCVLFFGALMLVEMWGVTEAPFIYFEF